MYFLLILFFTSLLGIAFMIGRKLLVLQNGEILSNEEIILKTEYIEEWKHASIKNIKKYGYILLVITIRIYFRCINFIKNKYQEFKKRLKNIRHKNISNISEEKKQISKFLKIISEYKQKIREIKHKIKEEEENI